MERITQTHAEDSPRCLECYTNRNTASLHGKEQKENEMKEGC